MFSSRHTLRVLGPRGLFAFACACFLSAATVFAAPRTFTAKDGRTMEAELISFKGENLKVRRADTGREFILPLSSLSPTDREELRQFIADHPELRETIPASALRVEFSKSRADTERNNATYYDVTIEDWGYGITLTNLTNAPLEGLRVEYIVFAETDPDGASSSASRASEKKLERKRGSLAFEPVPVHGKSVLRTESFACRTEKLDGARWITSDGLKRKIRDRVLHGIWFRVYDGTTLLHESSSPDSLRTSERWGKSNGE